MKIDKLDILKLLFDLGEKESDRFWTRFNTFLYINSALAGIAAIGFSPDKFYVLLPISIIGTIVSIVWFSTLSWSFIYQDRWIKDQINILNSEPQLQKLITVRNTEFESSTFISKILNPRRGLWHAIPATFIILWVIFGLLGLQFILVSMR